MTCPTHGTPIYGGPIQYVCYAAGGHTVHAADLDREYHPQAVS
jgi:hypothetical protein